MSLEKKYQVQDDEYYELLFEAFEEIVKKQTKQTHFFLVAKFRCSISLSKLINKLVWRGRWLSSQNFPTQLLLTPIFQQHHDSGLFKTKPISYYHFYVLEKVTTMLILYDRIRTFATLTWTRNTLKWHLRHFRNAN